MLSYVLESCSRIGLHINFGWAAVGRCHSVIIFQNALSPYQRDFVA